MLALLETLVNTDSGSYDKAGRRCGRRAHPRTSSSEHGIATEVTPDEQFGDAITRHRRPGRAAARQPADPADGPPRHGVPQGRADAPAVPDRRRPRLWSRRRRHEGRPGDELLRARRHQAVRRRARAGDGAVHRRRGDRLAVLAPGDRAARARRARRVQLRARPRPRRGGDRPQGLPVHAASRSPARRRIRAPTSRSASARSTNSRTRRWRCMRSPISTKGITLNVGVVSGGQTVNTVAPWAKGEVDLRFITPADRDATHGQDRGDHGQELRAGHQRQARDHRRVPAAGRDRRRQGALRALRGGAARARPRADRRCSPAAAPIPALPPRWARRRSAPSARSAAARIRRTNTWRSTRWCRAPRRWRSPSLRLPATLSLPGFPRAL